jgi:hypothetical protein
LKSPTLKGEKKRELLRDYNPFLCWVPLEGSDPFKENKGGVTSARICNRGKNYPPLEKEGIIIFQPV